MKCSECGVRFTEKQMPTHSGEECRLMREERVFKYQD